MHFLIKAFLLNVAKADEKQLLNSMLKNMFILQYVQSGTYLKPLSIKINEEHKSQFSLFLVYTYSHQNIKNIYQREPEVCILL